MNLREAVEEMVDRIREDGLASGVIEFGHPGGPAVREVRPLRVGLARCQSYRARTLSALVQEVEDLVGEAGGGSALEFVVFPDRPLVLIDVR